MRIGVDMDLLGELVNILRVDRVAFLEGIDDIGDGPSRHLHSSLSKPQMLSWFNFIDLGKRIHPLEIVEDSIHLLMGLIGASVITHVG